MRNKSQRKARKAERNQQKASAQQQGLLYPRKTLIEWSESWFEYLNSEGREDEAIAALEASLFFERNQRHLISMSWN